VDEYDFAQDMPESTEITNIALMDTASATVLGNRVLGSLSDMVSQYTVSDYYTQINFRRSPKKVSNLEYDGFFKWLGNRDVGIPGMVMVDPVKGGAEYISFAEPMHYTESGFFADDLSRRLRFEFPTKIFHSVSFEVDDEGNPYYVVAVGRPRVGLFGAEDVAEVIELIKALKGKCAMIGVGLGHQLIALAYGAKTYKMSFGHHGCNHPVKNLKTGTIETVSQNHNYAVDAVSVDATALKVTHLDILDDVVEGLCCDEDRVFTVQYHPEMMSGPSGSVGFYDEFIHMMKEGK
jgi:anthranilate/para-aminobenzoate synthase component II